MRSSKIYSKFRQLLSRTAANKIKKKKKTECPPKKDNEKLRNIKENDLCSGCVCVEIFHSFFFFFFGGLIFLGKVSNRG